MKTRFICFILATFATALAVITVAFAWYAISVAYSPLPFWDQWERVTVDQLTANIFSQHNEHLIFIPSLFFIVDIAMFGGRNLFLLASIQLIQAAHAGLLVWLARRAGARGPGLFVVSGLTIALLFSGAQLENFYWGFQVQFVIVYLLATACLTVTVLARSGWKADAVAAALGFAAAFSFSAGLLVLPAAAVGALLGRRDWRRFAILATCAVVAAVLFSQGVQRYPHSDPVESLGNIVNVLYYTVVYLGGPFGHAVAHSPLADVFESFRDPVQAAKLFGSAGLAIAIILVPVTLLRRGPKARLVLLLTAGLVIGAGFLTALGRLELGAEQALSSRYATPVLIFWVAIASLVWSLARNLPLRAWRVGALLFLSASYVFVIGLLLSDRDAWLEMAQAQRDRTVGAESAILSGAPDRTAFAGVYPVPELVLQRSGLLADARISVFSREEAGWLNRPLVDLFNGVTGETCIGYVDERFVYEPSGATPGYSRLTGWGWDSRLRKSPRAYVLVDSNGIVRGFGRRAIDRPDVIAAVHVVTDSRTGWIAHAVVDPREPLLVYALSGRGRSKAACRIGEL